MFGSHPLEADGVNPNFFHALAKENKKELKSCRVSIPPTVLFEQGFAKAVFSTTTSKSSSVDDLGEVKMKAGRDVDAHDIFEMMTRGTQDGDVCATLMYAAQKTTTSDLSNVTFFDKNDLKNFLFHRVDKPKSLLQKFVKPKGNNNCMIHAIWSPLMVLTEGRRSSHSLTDRHLPVALRATTFEEHSANTVEVVVAKAVVKDISKMCQTIADHFEKAERVHLNRIACYFKVDEQNKVQLLCSSSLRIQDNVTGFNNSAVNLSTALESRGKKVDSKRTFKDDEIKLKEAEEMTKGMKISIPSMPDTATMLLHSIHASPSRGGGSRSKSPNATNGNILNKSSMSQGIVSSSGNNNNGGSPNVSYYKAKKMVRPSDINTGGGTTTSPGDHHHHHALSLSSNNTTRGAGGISSPLSQSSINSPSLNQSSQQQQQQPRSSSTGFSHHTPGGGVHHAVPSSALGVSTTHHGHQQSSSIVTKPGDFDLPQTGGENKLIYVAPGAPLPQSPALMKYQHMLPSSGTNLEIARRQRDLHATEAEIKHDWDAFLLQQQRSLNHLAAKQKTEQAALNAEAQSAQIASALEKRDAMAVPEIGHKTEFNLVTQEKKDEQLRGAGASPNNSSSQNITKSKGREEQMDDKEKFMAQVHQMMAKKSLKDLSAAGGGGSGNNTGEEIDSDTLPPQQSIVTPNRVPKSVLLPPAFARQMNAVHHSLPAGGIKSPSKMKMPVPQARTPSPTASQKQQQPKHDRKPSPTLSSDAEGGPTVQSLAAKRKAEAKAQGNAALRALSPTHAGSRERSEKIPDGSVVSFPASPSSKQGASTTEFSLKRKNSSTTKSNGSSSGMHEKENSQPNQRASRLLQKRSKISGDPSEVAIGQGLSDEDSDKLENQTRTICTQFQEYIQELVYAIYCFFLEHGPTTAAYVEVPEVFSRFISLKSINDLLHRLHGKVVLRSRYLKEHIPDHYLLLTDWRSDLLNSLHQGALKPYRPSDEDLHDIAGKKPKPKRNPTKYSVDPQLLAALSDEEDDENKTGSVVSGGGGVGGVRSPVSPGLHSSSGGLGSPGLHKKGPGWADLDVDGGSLLQDTTYCLVFPPLERSRDILKGEYAEGILEEVESYVSKPAGIFYYQTKLQLYHDLLNLPPVVAAAEEEHPPIITPPPGVSQRENSILTSSGAGVESESATVGGDEGSLKSPQSAVGRSSVAMDDAQAPSNNGHEPLHPTVRGRTLSEEELYCINNIRALIR